MAYTRTTWQQRLAQYQNRFSVVNNPDGTITLTPFEGTITQAGTAITPARLNNIEAAVEALANNPPIGSVLYLYKNAGGAL